MFTKDASREVVTLMQKIISEQVPWPEIPDAETALKNQVAALMMIGPVREHFYDQHGLGMFSTNELSFSVRGCIHWPLPSGEGKVAAQVRDVNKGAVNIARARANARDEWHKACVGLSMRSYKYIHKTTHNSAGHSTIFYSMLLCK